MAQTLLFGDQTLDIPSSLSELLSFRRDYRSLDLFLNDISRAFRQEVAQLPSNEQSWFPRVPLVEAFADASVTKTGIGTASQTFLTCVLQLGNLILVSERDPQLLEPQAGFLVVGICTGSLAGTAAATARSIPDLLLLADTIGRTAFRLGVSMQRRAAAIENTAGPWAFTVANIDAEDVAATLATYNTHLPVHKRVFVSSRSKTSFTFSGPPSSLHAFRELELFESGKTIELPSITAPYHAAHLGPIGLEDILSTLVPSVASRRTLRKIISTSSGSSDVGRSLYDSMVAAIRDIVESPLEWTLLLRGLAGELANTESTSAAVLRAIGPASCSAFLLKELHAAGISISQLPKLGKSASKKAGASSQDIAIVGMAGRFPGAEDIDELWEVLMAGLDLHKKIPKDRFDVDTHFDPTGALRNSTLSPYGVFIDEPGLFDVRMFNMSPREAAQTCPMQRLLLMTTYEALEMAGYAPGRTPSSTSSRIGSYFGQTSDDWREVNASQDVDTFFITGGIRAFGPGRLNYHFKWDGPSYSIDTACSSSAASIQLACSALLAGEIDTAVAGGANILTASDLFAGLSRGGFLSKTGGCKTFDDSADGYVRGDAVGTVVLKRLEDAQADNDNILAVIKAIATNHSSQAVSITHPHSETQQDLFRTVLRSSGLKPSDIDAVELHGTGTQAGDFTEFSSVLGVFGDRPLEQPIYVGSVKPNLGHGEAASGVTSLIKSVLMLQRNRIPPHVGIKGRINHRLPPLDSVPIKLAMRASEWPEINERKKRVLINNFDAAGGNTSMVIEAPPTPEEKGKDQRTHHVVCISGRTLVSFENNRARLLRFIQTNDVELASLAYTTTARRQHHVYRRAYKCRSISELIDLLENEASSPEPPARNSKPNAVFLFTGQGSQYSGMARELFDTNSNFRTWLTSYDTASVQFGFASFIGLVTGELATQDASPSQVQLAIVAIELALSKLWQSWGITPDALIGHSLGEYAALVAADILSPHDVLFLVGTRAQLMETLCSRGTHSMLAIKLDAASVGDLLTERALGSCEIACVNGPEATVVSGENEAIAALESHLISDGIKAKVLTVPFAFHSGQLDPILDAYGRLVDSLRPAAPKIPMLSTLTGHTIADNSTINAEYLTAQCREPVNYVKALETARLGSVVNDSTVWIEVGPKPICVAMVKATLDIPSPRLAGSLDGTGDWSSLSTALVKLYNAGYQINWNEVHREFEPHLRLLNIPSYAFDLKNYWIQYEGDWSITKNQVQTSSEPKTAPFSTTSMHHVVAEHSKGDELTVVFSTNIADPSLIPAVTGHQVNKVGLCPSSLYADMAMTAGDYLHQKLYPGAATRAIAVSDMEVTKPFVADPSRSDQTISLTARKAADSEVVHVTFSSETDGRTTEHAQCFLNYGNGQDWISEWGRQRYLIESRIQSLRHSEDSAAHKIHRRMVYKLFSSLVTYSDRYQGLTKVHLDSDAFEAVGDVSFPPTPPGEHFFFSPYWIDSLLHLSGFVLNGSDSTSDDAVYISHGWKTLRLPKKLEEGRLYQTYVRMQPLGSDQVMAGDVYIFDDGLIVGLCTGLKFQRIKKTILNHLLPNGTRASPPVQDVAFPRAARVPMTGAVKVRPAVEVDSFNNVLAMIAQEVQVSLSELSDDVEFAEVGVDSLLSLAITDKLRQLTDKTIPASIFLTYPTVAELRGYLQDSVTDSSSEDLDDSNSSSQRGIYSSANTSTEDLVELGQVSSGLKPTVLRQIIAEELGVLESEIVPETEFAEIGLDSLLSLAITGRVKSQTGNAIEPDFFLLHPTYGHVLKRYAPISVAAAPLASLQNPLQLAKAATSTLLQGNTGSKTSVFLFPDGSGSAAAYAGLSPISSDAVVYGLNSPYLRSGDVFDASIETIATSYVAELRSRRPRGPYILGGWSIGGVYAYEAARQLILQGEQVSGILLIDSPCPKRLPPMSEATVDLLASQGIFGTERSIPVVLRQHFLGSIKALHRYQPQPIPTGGRAIPTVALWAREGVFEGPAHTKLLGEITSDGINDWLLLPRTKHDSTGWDELLPKYEFTVVDGNHFTMFRKPLIDALSVHIKEALRSIRSRR